MTKKSLAVLVEEFAAEIATQSGADQNSARAFLGTALKALKDKIVEAALPTGAKSAEKVSAS